MRVVLGVDQLEARSRTVLVRGSISEKLPPRGLHLLIPILLWRKGELGNEVRQRLTVYCGSQLIHDVELRQLDSPLYQPA